MQLVQISHPFTVDAPTKFERQFGIICVGHCTLCGFTAARTINDSSESFGDRFIAHAPAHCPHPKGVASGCCFEPSCANYLYA